MGSFRNRIDRCRRQVCNKKSMQNWIERLFPILVWLRNYSVQNLRYDIVAGITVGITMVPQCLAYGSLANVKPEIGLYSAFAAQLVYVIFGTSKDASIGPDAVICMITGHIAAEVTPFYDDYDPVPVAILALFSGIVLVAMAILKLGFIVRLFSFPVVSAFMSAAGLTIAASQLKGVFGLKRSPATIPGVFVKQIINVVNYGANINWYDVAFAGVSVAFLLFMQYLPVVIDKIAENHLNLDENETKKKKYDKYMKVLKFICACKNVILFIAATGAAYGMFGHDTENALISLVGYIKPGMPTAQVPPFEIVNITQNVTATNGSFALVKDRWETVSGLAVGGFIILPLMLSLEMFAILKSLGSKNGYRVDARQELLALGLGNFVTAFIGGMPVVPAVTRCALNDQCQVQTQLGSVISAGIVLLCLNTLTGVFYYIPKATLSAVVMVAALNLVDIRIIPDVWRHCRGDAILLVLTLLICVFFEISYGVLLCLFINMLMFLKAIGQMEFEMERKSPEAVKKFSFGSSQPTSSVGVVKLSHGMKYPTCEKFLAKIEPILLREPSLIIDCTFVQSVDYTGIQAFRSLLLLAINKGRHVVFTNLNDEVNEQLEKLGLDNERFVSSFDETIGTYNKAIIITEMEKSVTGSDTSLSAVEAAASLKQEKRAVREFTRRLSVAPHWLSRDIPMSVGGGVVDYHDEKKLRNRKNSGGSADQKTPVKKGHIHFLNDTLLRQVARCNQAETRRPSLLDIHQKRLPVKNMRRVSYSGNLYAGRPKSSSQSGRRATALPDDLQEAINDVGRVPAVNFLAIPSDEEGSDDSGDNNVDKISVVITNENRSESNTDNDSNDGVTA